MAYDVTGKQTRRPARRHRDCSTTGPFGNPVICMAGNPPTSRNVTVRYGQLQSLGRGGLTTQGAPALTAIELRADKLPTSTQWNGGVQMALPWAVTLDVEYVGQHSFNTVPTVNINTVDFGAAFLPQNQDPTAASSTTPGGDGAAQTDLLRLVSAATRRSTMRQFDGWRTYHSLQMSFNRRFRNGVSFGFNDTIGLSRHGSTRRRVCSTPPTARIAFRADQAEADELLGDSDPPTHILQGELRVGSARPAERRRGRCGRSAWSSTTGSCPASGPARPAAPTAVGFSYQSGGSNVNLTGSPDYAARVRVVGDPGAGCSGDVYRQFNTAAFQGPLANSVGLESGNGYLRGCFIERARPVDRAQHPDGRQPATSSCASTCSTRPNAAEHHRPQHDDDPDEPGRSGDDPNLPYDAAGNLIDARSLPRGAGFGVANGYQAPRSVQAQVRFSF